MERELASRERLATLGQMATTVAHEVKNPLSSIKSIAQVMREEDALSDYDRDLGLIVSEIDRLNRTVSQLLAFSRPSNADPRPVALRDLIEYDPGPARQRSPRARRRADSRDQVGRDSYGRAGRSLARGVEQPDSQRHPGQRARRHGRSRSKRRDLRRGKPPELVPRFRKADRIGDRHGAGDQPRSLSGASSSLFTRRKREARGSALR